MNARISPVRKKKGKFNQVNMKTALLLEGAVIQQETKWWKMQIWRIIKLIEIE